jgi:hypothetical protein
MPLEQSDLDAWLADPQIRTNHRRSAAVEPAALWSAAEEVRLTDAPRLGRVLRWRIPGTPPDIRYGEVFRRYPFTVLDEGELWSISGLCGRVWGLRSDYPQLSGAQEFRDWREPGTVRIIFAHWIEASDGGGAELVSESRVEPVDRGARWRMRALWSALGRFEGLIGREALEAAVSRVEDHD